MFDPGKELPKSYVSLSDHIGGKLSDSDDDSCGHAMNNDSRVQHPAQNHANYKSWNGMQGRFGAESETYMVEDDESGISTPLWRTSPLWSPPHQPNINYRCLSPSSKAQAIARGQRELMEMVSRMPESCYELSLKDLVEHQPVVEEAKQESFAEVGGSINENSYTKEKGKNKKKNQTNQKLQINRSGSLDNGRFLLKLVFPVSLGSKKNKKKKNNSKTNNNSKVPTKPTVADASGKAVDKDWWNKRPGSTESESGGSTVDSESTKSSRSSSSSSGGSTSCRSISTTSRRRRRNGCLAFILSRRSKDCGKRAALSHP